MNLRLTDGEVVRLQCAVLPNGGRMLSYTYVTDIVRRSDELAVLRAALDSVPEEIILLDSDLNAQFMNQAVRRLWSVSDEQAGSCPAYAELVGDARHTGAYGIATQSWKSSLRRASLSSELVIRRRAICVQATGDTSDPNVRCYRTAVEC